MNKFSVFSLDDSEFPVFSVKSVEKQGVMEGAGDEDHGEKGAVFESSSTTIDSMAMSAVLAWVDEGDYSFDAFADFVAGIADLDGDDEYTDEEEELYNDIMAASADALLSLGADADNVDEFLNAESESAGEALGEFLSDAVTEESASDLDVIAGFASGGIFEASFKKMKVVRDGKVVIKKKRLGKVVLSAAQRAALKKARRKAFTGAAKLKRKKSMKIRSRRGM